MSHVISANSQISYGELVAVPHSEIKAKLDAKKLEDAEAEGRFWNLSASVNGLSFVALLHRDPEFGVVSARAKVMARAIWQLAQPQF